MAKLIIIRGPAGAGKSTVAKELVKQIESPTVHIEQDHFRSIFNDESEATRAPREQMMLSCIDISLQNNVNVILEGILGTGNYKKYVSELLDKYKETYIFYLDVSFDETIKRHSTRDKKSQFGSDVMREWWDYAHPLKHPSETIIDENSSPEDSVNTILKVSGLK